jgi:hypothetical protein
MKVDFIVRPLSCEYNGAILSIQFSVEGHVR